MILVSPIQVKKKHIHIIEDLDLRSEFGNTKEGSSISTTRYKSSPAPFYFFKEHSPLHFYFYFQIPTMDKCDIIHIHLTGRKNHMGLSFHLKHFVQGQGLAGFQDGTSLQPTGVKAKENWTQNNSKVVSKMWKHLRKLYHQTNKSQKYYTDIELAKYYLRG